MKSVLVFMCLAFFIVCNSLIAQDVAIYNDKSPAWIDPAQMVPAAQKALDAKKNNIRSCQCRRPCNIYEC